MTDQIPPVTPDKAILIYQIVIDYIQDVLPVMNCDMRKEFFDKITEHYCPNCGGEHPCHCQNDE